MIWRVIVFWLLGASLALADLPQRSFVPSVTFCENRNGKVRQFQYDGANRLTNTISPLGHSFSQVYNNRGLLQSTTDPLGQTTSFTYSYRDLLDSMSDNLGYIDYSYIRTRTRQPKHAGCQGK
jgi:YD repeat-containing protein